MSSDLPKIHAALAHAGYASRRKVEVLISEGRVKVNGAVAQIGQRIDPSKDKVEVDGEHIPLHQEVRLLFLVDKPIGIVSTTEDELGRQTVVEYLLAQIQKTEPKKAAELAKHRLYPVGRLDLESEGLLLLTNDGALTHQYTHPSFESMKTYHVTINDKPTQRALAHLERGVMLREGYTAPATVEVITSNSTQTILAITIHEGRNQQIRRMMRRVGYDVVKLVRVMMGPHHLDELDGKPYKDIS